MNEQIEETIRRLESRVERLEEELRSARASDRVIQYAVTNGSLAKVPAMSSDGYTEVSAELLVPDPDSSGKKKLIRSGTDITIINRSEYISTSSDTLMSVAPAGPGWGIIIPECGPLGYEISDRS